MLFGGVRQHLAVLNGLQADAFRSASQSQGTGQAARAFSGSSVTNTQTQLASFDQQVVASKTDTVTINSATDELEPQNIVMDNQLIDTNTGMSATGAAFVEDLPGALGLVDHADITITVQRPDGTIVSDDVDTLLGLGGMGLDVTIDDILSAINEAANSTDSSGATAGISDGRITLTANEVGGSPIDLRITGINNAAAVDFGDAVAADADPDVQHIESNTALTDQNTGSPATSASEVEDLTGSIGTVDTDEVFIEVQRPDGNVLTADVATILGVAPATATIDDVLSAINDAANSTDASGATAGISGGVITLTANEVGGQPIDLRIWAVDDGAAIDFGNFFATDLPDVDGADRIDGFNYNYLQRYLAGLSASDHLARGASNVVQSQGGDQSAYAKLNDFDGVDSTAYNGLNQVAEGTQNFNVDLAASVTNRTDTDLAEEQLLNSRYRTVEAETKDQSAQAIFTTGQRQGSADHAISQVAVANGAQADNTLMQLATLTQTNNTVDLSGTFDLTRVEAAQSPRSTDLLVKVNELGGVSSAINSSSLCQEQAIVQSAAGGVDEVGCETENGGTASNSGGSQAVNQESTAVTNTITITI